MPGADPSRYLEWLRAETAPADGETGAIDGLEESLVHPRLLLLEEAAGWKSAFLRELAYLWCRGVEDARTYTLLFPIFVPMPDLRPEAGNGWLLDYLAVRSRELQWGLDGEFFRRKLAAALVMIERLDAAPWAAGAIERMAGANPRSRFVVTARPMAMELAGFHTVRAGRRST